MDIFATAEAELGRQTNQSQQKLGFDPVACFLLTIAVSYSPKLATGLEKSRNLSIKVLFLPVIYGAHFPPSLVSEEVYKCKLPARAVVSMLAGSTIRGSLDQDKRSEFIRGPTLRDLSKLCGSWPIPDQRRQYRSRKQGKGARRSAESDGCYAEGKGQPAQRMSRVRREVTLPSQRFYSR